MTMEAMLLPFVFMQAVPASDDANGILGAILKALGDRSWIALAGAVTIGLVYVVRTWGKGWIPWLATDRGGVVLVVVCGVLTGIGSALADGSWTWKELVDGIATALVAAGGYSLTKKAVAPTDKPPGPVGG